MLLLPWPLNSGGNNCVINDLKDNSHKYQETLWASWHRTLICSGPFNVSLMKLTTFFVLLYIFGYTSSVEEIDQNERPIIGILAQETSTAFTKRYPGMKSYIAASYVKGVEGSGARVVPVFINQTEEYYRDLLGSINGVLFPGGATWFYNKDGYADAGKIIMDIVKEANQNGTHIPILGICLGFELLLFIDNGMREYRTNCHSKDVALPLEFKNNYRNALLFRKAPYDIIQILKKEPVTVNEHQFCVTEENMTSYGLVKDWKVLSVNQDDNFNLTFVSSVESRKYPFVGIQFHPEKNMYEWKEGRRYPHTQEAIEAGRFFFDWLVKHARLNGNKFENSSDETESLIYKYPTTYTGADNMIYEEAYLFS